MNYEDRSIRDLRKHLEEINKRADETDEKVSRLIINDEIDLCEFKNLCGDVESYRKYRKYVYNLT